VFVLACIALVATPGPNVLYLVSRTLAQGRAAGFVSVAGTSTGFLFHVLAAAFGLSAILAAVPVAFDAVTGRALTSRGSRGRRGARPTSSPTWRASHPAGVSSATA
jgi:hypothetical protein